MTKEAEEEEVLGLLGGTPRTDCLGLSEFQLRQAF